MSWPATVPQFIALGMMLTVGWLVSQSPQGVACGAIVYLTYSFLSRRLIANSHRRGIELARSGRFNEAIGSYERSYEFFTRHVWLDRYRAITMMTPSAVCYREMALVNIAYAYLQLGDEKTACDYYERTLNEFPESEMATDSLLMLKGDGNSSLHNEQDSRRMN